MTDFLTREDALAFVRANWQDPVGFHQAVAAHFAFDEDEYAPVADVLDNIAGELDSVRNPTEVARLTALAERLGRGS